MLRKTVTSSNACVRRAESYAGLAANPLTVPFSVQNRRSICRTILLSRTYGVTSWRSHSHVSSSRLHTVTAGQQSVATLMERSSTGCVTSAVKMIRLAILRVGSDAEEREDSAALENWELTQETKGRSRQRQV